MWWKALFGIAAAVSFATKVWERMKKSIRVVTRGADGSLRVRDYETAETLLKLHVQIGVDDCSTDLTLRGLPLFKGLIGPIPEGKSVVRYESPEVFETLTKEWSTAKHARRRRRSKLELAEAAAANGQQSAASG